MKTIGRTLDEYKGIGPGFDFLRVALASFVLLNHSFLIVNGDYHYFNEHHLWSIFGNVVPMFFALSGFLITGSAQRLRLRDFLLNRGIRIVPALAVDILISALIIGPLVTSFALQDYWTHGQFLGYFVNIIGFIHYELPGVFLDNPFPNQVNGSLWTIPYEIGCYGLITLFILLRIINRPRHMLVIALLMVGLFYVVSAIYADRPFPFASIPTLHNYISHFFGIRGGSLYLYFTGGILIYLFRYYIPFTLWLALPAAFLAIWLNFGQFGAAKWIHVVLTLPVGYLAAYIGLLRIPRLPLYKHGDYSYGMYLYGYPLQQLIIMLLPGLSVVAHFVLSLISATLVAMASWHGVEKPILATRRKFSFTARKTEDHVSLPRPTAANAP